MAGSMNIFETITGAYDAFTNGGFNGNNEWVSDLNSKPTPTAQTSVMMDEEQNYAIPSINAVATPYIGMDEQQNYEVPNGLSLFNPNQQINAAGTSSPDGMMTTPTLPLYPGEAIGIDGVPYRPNAGQNNNPSSYSYEPNQGGSVAGSSTPVADVLNARQFNQRTPSGSVYAPDMSAYNDSSLFNYTGPGGVPEYTYGQGLRTGGANYSIFGSPADAANPYFEGQFAKSVGPADAAINMPAIEMPAGIPAIGGGSGTTTAPIQNASGITPRPPNSAGDLTYQQTIDEMGIFGPNNPPPSTQFPSPGGATALANLGLTERQIAQMSPQQQAYMTQALADQNRMQQGQIGAVTLPDYGGMEFASATNQINNSSDGEELARKNFLNSNNGYDLGRPGDPSYREFVSNPLDEAVTNYNAENLTTQQKMDMLQARADQVYGNMTAEEKRDGLFIEPTYSVSKDTMKLGIPDIFSTNNENVSSTGNLINRESPERNIFKADEIDIPTPPFRPEGVEGEDYYQDVTGDYFAMEDDLGTQPLKTGNMADDTSPFTTDYSEPMNVFAGMPLERGFFKTDEAGIDKPATLSSYEADGDIESTSNNMGALDDSYAAIDAKYAGSTTNESQLAKLKEVIAATNNEYGGSGPTNARGSRGDTVPADIPAFLDQNISRMADNYIPSPAETDYPAAYQSYAREDEGTITGESLFQNVATSSSPTGTVYPGANKPLDLSNRIDQVVAQAMAQQAQIQAAAAREPDVKVTPANVASIFNPRPSGPLNMAQIKSMVAKTQNNMTVPKMRDAALTKRYGNPYSL